MKIPRSIQLDFCERMVAQGSGDQLVSEGLKCGPSRSFDQLKLPHRLGRRHAGPIPAGQRCTINADGRESTRTMTSPHDLVATDKRAFVIRYFLRR